MSPSAVCAFSTPRTLLLFALSLLCLATPSHGELLHALLVASPGDLYRVVSFDSSDPATLLADFELLYIPPQSGATLMGLEADPATGRLWTTVTACPVPSGCIASVLSIDPTSGTTFPTGMILSDTFPFTLAGFFFDFDSLAQELRVVELFGPHRRFDPTTGALLGTETPMPPQYVSTGLAYSPPAAGTSTLYGTGSFNGISQLVRIGGVGGDPSPNTGQVTAIGPLGFAAANADFDISRSGVGYAMVQVPALRGEASQRELARVDLTSGAATRLGVVGAGLEVVGVAAAQGSPSVTPEVPTLHTWALAALALTLGVIGARRLRG